jgi:murein DD-endopeptidase MepM/ murein hydrolase activator NlpD
VGFVDGVGRTADLGNFVRVTHLFGIQTLYGHLDRVDVSPGQLVIPGLGTLGLVGATGRATGPHLHFGVFWAGIPLPPEAFLVFHSLRRQLWGG